jgi:hypothetical protein
MSDERVYLDDSYSKLVEFADGHPVRFSMQAAGDPPPSPAEEADLIARIRAVTGFVVRFGTWVVECESPPMDRSFTVPLVVVAAPEAARGGS